MRVAIIADTFPPLRTSGAIQLRDLSREFAAQGNAVTVIVASPDIAGPYKLEDYGNVEVLRLKAPRTKDISYVRRTINEFVTPFVMQQNFQRSPLANAQFDGVVWYSPSIFLAPFVKALKRKNSCPTYLIIRDIFPQWAADMGLMERGLAYHLLNRVARFQYSVADVIGVQSPGNLPFLQSAEAGRHFASIEVLHNWLGSPTSNPCSIDITRTSLYGRRIFVYAGNMGVAQGMDKLLRLAVMFRSRADIGFLFVGRGSDADRIAAWVKKEGLNNVLVHDEIDPDEIPALYGQCDVGLVSLDHRHTTHNIPGKFLSYIQSGMPVLASVNCGNDLVKLIAEHDVGRVSVDPTGEDLADQALALLDSLALDVGIGERCRALSDSIFSAVSAAQQIVAALETR
ncbi:MAG: glycosyltransferase WbuB [Sphingomonadaceae bacterium PASS1]|nr:MAG: glycosyltransferase WbuB [Sphingomonadaceae bacterium PASS1]